MKSIVEKLFALTVDLLFGIKSYHNDCLLSDFLIVAVIS